MARLPELEALELRRRVLVARSDLYRATMRLEVQNIQARTAWVGRALDAGRKAAPWLALIAPLATLVMKKRRAGVTRRSWIGNALLAWQLASRLKTMWSALHSSHSSSARDRVARTSAVDSSVNGAH